MLKNLNSGQIMRKLIGTVILSFVFINITNAQNDINDEILAINNVLDQIINHQWPGNPYSDFRVDIIRNDSIIHITNGSIIKSAREEAHRAIDSKPFLLYIPDTLFSLKKIVKDKKWIYKAEPYEPMYRFLIKHGSLHQLNDIIFDTKQFKNTWKYSIIDRNLTDWPKNINYLKLNISRVCFNSNKTLGFFYIEVLDYSDTGYVTLILIEKDKRSKSWKIINGTYYD